MGRWSPNTCSDGESLGTSVREIGVPDHDEAFVFAEEGVAVAEAGVLVEAGAHLLHALNVQITEGHDTSVPGAVLELGQYALHGLALELQPGFLALELGVALVRALAIGAAVMCSTPVKNLV